MSDSFELVKADSNESASVRITILEKSTLSGDVIDENISCSIFCSCSSRTICVYFFSMTREDNDPLSWPVQWSV